MLLDDGAGKREPRVALPVRVPKSLVDYIRKRAGDRRGQVTRVIEDAVMLHRALFEKMAPHKLRLQQLALDLKLDWETQESEVYARAMIMGLEQHEKHRK